MKKQFITLTTVVTIFVLVSCSKGNLGQPDNAEEIATSANAEKGNGSSFNASRKLEFWLPFNSNLNEGNGKQISATIENGSTPVYTTDRFGSSNNAIKFDGIYRIVLSGMRVVTNMSVSVWVKYESATGSGFVFEAPLGINQSNDKFSGSISTPSTQGVQSNSLDAGWHHLVATYDGSYIRFYVDGNFVGENLNQGTFSGGSQDSMFWLGDGWQGSMDDVRFYTRTLSASDVQALYHLQ